MATWLSCYCVSILDLISQFILINVYKKKCDQLIETGRVRQSAVKHCQIRLVYSKSGVIAYVRFTRATN